MEEKKEVRERRRMNLVKREAGQRERDFRMKEG